MQEYFTVDLNSLPPNTGRKPWYRSGFVGIVVFLTIFFWFVLSRGRFDEEEVKEDKITSSTTIPSTKPTMPSKYRIPLLNSDNLQDRIRISTCQSTMYGEHILRIFLHLYSQAKSGKHRYRMRFGKFHSKVMQEAQKARSGRLEGKLIEELHETPRHGLVYLADLCLYDELFEFRVEFATVWEPVLNVSDYAHLKKRKAVAVIAARNDEDFEKERKRMVVYLRGVKDDAWTMYDDAEGWAESGIADEVVRDLKAVGIIFHNRLTPNTLKNVQFLELMNYDLEVE